MKHRTIAALFMAAALLAAGTASPVLAEGNAPAVTAESALLDTSDLFTSRDSDAAYKENKSVLIEMKGGEAVTDSDAVSIDGGTITLTEAGTYIVTGEWNGMIIVDVDKTEKVQLVLHGAAIHSESSAALYIRQADKVFLTLAEGTENSLSNGGTFAAIDENNIDAALFSKDDLSINGAGSLTVASPAGHGVVSKDDLVITGGSFEISAGSHGLSGQDSVRILDGSFRITAGKDGVHADNAEDSEKGYVYIGGGAYQITSGGDGLSASGVMQIDGGAYTLQAGGGSTGQTARAEEGRGFFGGGFPDAEDAVSAKGVKASGNLLINGGAFELDTLDDAVHSNASVTLNGGSLTIATDDDAFHADDQLIITDGTIRVTRSYEGLEGRSIDVLGGTIAITSEDDGLNAAGGKDESGFGGFRGPDHFAADPNSYIHIAGGTLTVSAEGDGVDSNGNLYVSGGETYVLGPVSRGNSALDYNGEGIIAGGVMLAVGAEQMAQGFGEASAQGVIMVVTGSQPAGSAITLTDAQGQALLTWTADKAFECVVISCPAMEADGVYTLTAGGYEEQIAMDGLVYGGFAQGPGGGFGGGRGGHRK